MAEFGLDYFDLKILNIGKKHFRLRINRLRYQIFINKESKVVVKNNKIIIKMHKKEPLLWKELRQEFMTEEERQKSNLDHIKKIFTLKGFISIEKFCRIQFSSLRVNKSSN